MRINFKQKLCPYSEQKCVGVLLSISFAFITAPAETSALITVKWPLKQAICNGVLKLLFLASI